MNSKNEVFPKKIWFLWFQGYENAPFLVEQCLKSWKNNNPSWEIVFLHENNLNDYINLDLKNNVKLSRLSKNKQANLARLLLLSKHGGVWVDSTCFCMKPLDEWLDDYLVSGFFAFASPGKDRLMSNWFLASTKNNPIVSKLYKKLFLYLTVHEYQDPRKSLLMKLCKSILCNSTSTTKYWFHPLFTKILKIYPYYNFHYLFTELVSTDSECKEIWSNTPKYSANSCHKMLKHMHEPLSMEMRQDIDERLVPVYKLNWKRYKREVVKKGSTVYYLLQTA